jgi:cytidylate kinase
MAAERKSRPIIVTVDGPAASGKGSMARRLAAHFGYAHLDTGLLYRAVGLVLIREGISPENTHAAAAAAQNLSADLLVDPSLRDDEVANMASRVAAIPAVREALINYQRGFAHKPPDGAPGAVLDGRDIGTVICPGADYKIFVDASLEARVDRRVKELRERGVEAIYARVLQDMRERDTRDRTRAVAPLVPAEDAFLLDTTTIDAEAAFAAALEFIKSRDKSDA